MPPSYRTPLLQVTTDKNEWSVKAARLSERAKLGCRYPAVKQAPKLRFEHEASRYEEVAIAHQIAGEFLSAAETYGRAAAIRALELRCPAEAAGLYLKAATAAEKVRPASAEHYCCLVQSQACKAENYALAGRAQEKTALRHVALCDDESAIGAFERAANYFLADSVTSKASEMKERAAHLTGMVGRYMDAASMYMVLGKEIIDAKSQDATESLFLCALLHFAATGPNEKLLRDKLDALTKLDPMFERSREGEFTFQLFECLALNFDLDSFADHVYKYDCVVGLGVLQLRALQELRRCLEGKEALKNGELLKTVST